MRGNLHLELSDPAVRVIGSIPARAGEPLGPVILPCRTQSGLSPHARGNPYILTVTSPSNLGSIPACAGEPEIIELPVDISAVRSIPARAGEPGWDRDPGPCAQSGLSPHARGKPRTTPAFIAGRGRVYPRACGETRISNRPKACIEEWVYPRACGGTGNNRLPVAQGQGLSPRVRGNLIGCRVDPAGIGSIPARAGKPLHLPGARASA